jgi:aminoglycoside phosphotransferase family enzyme
MSGRDHLRLGGKGTVVDWLVKMRRLPSALMLDTVIKAGQADAAVVSKVAALLSRFYAGLAPVPMSPSDYIERFEREIDEHRRELAIPDYGMPDELVSSIALAQANFLQGSAGLLRERINGHRIVEGHGDLRPEHVFVGSPPVVIDCLEFNKQFRIVDPADELAFLWMECAFLGAPAVGGDRSHRACLRAKLSLWHLKDHDVREPGKWRSRAKKYLGLADHAARQFAVVSGQAAS